MGFIKRKLLVFFLVVALVISSAIPVLAYEALGPVTNPTIVKNDLGRDITVNDIDGGKEKDRTPTNDEIMIYKQAIQSNNVLHYWSQMAYQIFKSNSSTYWDHRGKGFDEDFGMAGYVDLLNDFQQVYRRTDKSGGQVSYGIDCSGLSVANSLKQVQERACDDLANLPGRKFKGSDYLKRHQISALNDKERTVLYTTVSTFDRYGLTPQVAYNSFTIAFYDFRLNPISNGDVLPSKVTVLPKETKSSMISLTENYDYEPVASSSTLTNSTTESYSTSITDSSSYSFGQHIGMSYHLGGKLALTEIIEAEAGFQIDASLDFAQTIETAYGEEHSIETTEEKSSTFEKETPAHTKQMATQTLSKATQIIEYDCPVAITYKVAIFSMCGTCYDDGGAVASFSTAGYEQRSFITQFGEGGTYPIANDCLYQRGVAHKTDNTYDQTYGKTVGTNQNGTVKFNSLDWNKISNQDKAKSKYNGHDLLTGTELISKLADNYQMSLTGAKTTAIQDSISTQYDTAKPIYPIKIIRVNYQINREFNMNVGDTHPINSYRVQAFDKDEVPYYGFVQETGIWKIVDASGREASSDVARIEYDNISKEQRIIALKPGTVYVKYFIPEKTYYTYDNVESKNSEIEAVAYKVVVSEPAAPETPKFDGTLVVEGSVNAVVNEVLNLNGEPTVTVTALDKTGKEVEPAVSWEAKELSSKGITVEPNGKLITTSEGTFHVRAYIDDIYSDWIEVYSSLPAEEVVQIKMHTFDDVQYKSWYNKAVEYVKQNGLMNGYSLKEFAPADGVSRAMVIQVLYNKAGKPVPTSIDSFSDIDKNAWYAKAVAWAQEKGLAEGYADDTFRPTEKITREQLAAFFTRYAKEYGVGNAGATTGATTGAAIEFVETVDISTYKDSDQVSAWAQEHVEDAVSLGLMSGDNKNQLNPQGNATRAELAQVVMNMDTIE